MVKNLKLYVLDCVCVLIFILVFFSRLKTRKGEDGCSWKESHNHFNWSVKKNFPSCFYDTVLMKSSSLFSAGALCLICQRAFCIVQSDNSA